MFRKYTQGRAPKKYALFVNTEQKESLWFLRNAIKHPFSMCRVPIEKEKKYTGHYGHITVCCEKIGEALPVPFWTGPDYSIYGDIVSLRASGVLTLVGLVGVRVNLGVK